LGVGTGSEALLSFLQGELILRKEDRRRMTWNSVYSFLTAKKEKTMALRKGKTKGEKREAHPHILYSSSFHDVRVSRKGEMVDLNKTPAVIELSPLRKI